MNDGEVRTTDASQRILVIDDEAVVCMSCLRILTSDGHSVDCMKDPHQGLQAALEGDYDLILLDLVMPHLSGIEILEQIKATGVSSEVVIITGYSTVATAVKALKLGAADYLSKPFTPDDLRAVLNKVFERSALIRENTALRIELAQNRGFQDMIGKSTAMERVFSVIKRVAPTQGTVLITGESGTGKEMVARAIHDLSTRSKEVFLACDCMSLAPSLLESEIFGHVKGSFSGAIATKQGLFEVAHRGTLFLDEISNMGLETQGKLLRVLETRKVRKVGDTRERDVDIRLIAATNSDLKEMVQNGTFREDLFYRLNVVPIHIPPLREREGDIPRLAMAFLEKFQQDSHINVQGFTPETMQLLEEYSWPGNVREIRNVVERVSILCDSKRIEPRHLPLELISTPSTKNYYRIPDSWDELKQLKQKVKTAAVRDLERRFIIQALQKAEGNISRAAELIGMQRTNLHALIRRHELTELREDSEGFSDN